MIVKSSKKNPNKEITKETILSLLKKVQDPELGVSIVDLGLIYDIEIKNDMVKVKMTLTYPGCPLGSFIIQEIKQTLSSLPNIKTVEVELVWDPVWKPERIKKEIREELGL